MERNGYILPQLPQIQVSRSREAVPEDSFAGLLYRSYSEDSPPTKVNATQLSRKRTYYNESAARSPDGKTDNHTDSVATGLTPIQKIRKRRFG